MRGNKLKIPPSIFVAFMFSASAYGGMTFIKGDTTNNAEVKSAGIYFNGPINNQTITWLMSGATEIHANYRNVDNIDIYLNSEGGDMDASFVAYEFFKTFPIKINMINASMTGSAATIIYCASDNRYAMPMANFLLHPAAASYDKTDYIKPDQAKRIVEEDDAYNKMFQKVYASCTTLTPDELHQITAAESGRKMYDANNAIKHGLVTKGETKVKTYLVTYFINDAQG
jgi:ATP-dependent Clp protease protease subunit